jgi:hypothetical protein
MARSRGALRVGVLIGGCDGGDRGSERDTTVARPDFQRMLEGGARMGLRASEVEPRGPSNESIAFTGQKIMRLVESNGARLRVHGADARRRVATTGVQVWFCDGVCRSATSSLAACGHRRLRCAPTNGVICRRIEFCHRRAVPNAAYPRWQALRRLSEPSQTLNRWHADDILAEGPFPTRRRSCVCLTGLA